MTTPNVITRFAPSPTGFLHIGGARTALFNYYFAKHMGGKFLLRIEDTDKARSEDGATQAIIDGLSWLGVHHDGEIVYQSKNAERQKEVAYDLLSKGMAYKCYLPADEAAQLKEQRIEKFRNTDNPNDITGFSTEWRFKTKETEEPYVIRFKAPHKKHPDWNEHQLKGKYEENDDHMTTFDHVLQRTHGFARNLIDDFVLLRSDKTPTYMLAVIVDDHDMGITHVIRGDDHFFNGAKQELLYRALGWDVPQWAHVPLIHGPDGKKLSKRHGALGAEAYRDMGYLPGGLRNYLLKLGWAHGDEELFFTDEDISKVFTLEGINAAPARLDFDKMDYINGQHILREPNDNLMAQALPFLEDINEGPLSDDLNARVLAAMDTLKPRAKTLKELAEQARYLMLKRPIEITGKTAKPLKKEGAIEHISSLTLRLKSLEDPQWSEEAIQALLQAYVSENDIGFGKIGQPVRAALTGGAPSPDLSWVLALLGKNEVLRRLSDVIDGDFGKKED